MKKFLLLLLALTLSLGLFACGDNDGEQTEDNKTPVEEVDLSKGIQTVAPYKIYNEDETELDGKDYESMFTAIVNCIQVSKMYWQYINKTQKPLFLGSVTLFCGLPHRKSRTQTKVKKDKKADNAALVSFFLFICV